MKRLGWLLMVVVAILALPGVVCVLCFGGRVTSIELVLGGIAAIGIFGSFSSLSVSSSRAKRRTSARVLREASSAAEAWLLATVEREARSASIRVPTVAIYPAREPNAFVVGAHRDRAFLGISEGLVTTLSQDDIEAVLGGLISQAASGDMVTMGLLQGVLDTFVFFPASLASVILDRGGARPNEGDGKGFVAVANVLTVVLAALPAWIVARFSRRRILRADAGGAHLAGKRKMVSTLQKLRSMDQPSSLSRGMAGSGFFRGSPVLFSMHPTTDARLEGLASS